MSTDCSETRSLFLVRLIAMPPALVAVGAVLLVLLGAFGANPFWSTADLTMAEAAALRDQASVAALARAGIDPSARMRVRAGLLRGNRTDLQLTPAQAAVRANRPEILDVLMQSGLRLDAARAHALVCEARLWRSQDALAALLQRFPNADEPCPEPF